MMGWGYGMGAGMWISWLLIVIVIAIVVLLVIHTVRSGDSSGRQDRAQPPVGRPTPAEILAQRYARGEISTDEYEERLSHLGG